MARLRSPAQAYIAEHRGNRVPLFAKDKQEALHAKRKSIARLEA
jgi:hypothetical protein